MSKSKYIVTKYLDYIDDEIVRNLFRTNKTIVNSILSKYYCNKYEGRYDKNIYSYIENRFDDSKSFKESLYRICLNHIKLNKCLQCGKEIPYRFSYYKKFCSARCSSKWCNSHGLQNTKEQCKKAQESRLKTFKEKYGVENPGSIKEVKEKVKTTCLKKYGVINVFASDIIKEKLDYKNQTLHAQNTKRKNHTFNTSKSEDKTYDILKRKYPDIIRQYTSKEYPYNCDFYIPSKDLYIECNYHWTHGKHPYNKENDKEKLEYWKSKGTKYYNNAIHTWTVLDVKKRQIAKENNLNYIEIWNIDEISKI